MSTPFHFVDHKADARPSLPIEEKRILRRGAPEVLNIMPTESDLPLLQVDAARAPAPGVGTGDRAGWLARLFRGLRHVPT